MAHPSGVLVSANEELWTQDCAARVLHGLRGAQTGLHLILVTAEMLLCECCVGLCCVKALLCKAIWCRVLAAMSVPMPEQAQLQADCDAVSIASV
jgi:hypothetical protein